jgi:hypothetical protein
MYNSTVSFTWTDLLIVAPPGAIRITESPLALRPVTSESEVCWTSGAPATLDCVPWTRMWEWLGPR